MSRYKHTRVFTIPAARRRAVNAALERHGYGPDNFSIELQNRTAGITTHYGCSITMTDEMRDIINGAIGVGGEEHNKSFERVLSDKNLRRKVVKN